MKRDASLPIRLAPPTRPSPHPCCGSSASRPSPPYPAADSSHSSSPCCSLLSSRLSCLAQACSCLPPSKAVVPPRFAAAASSRVISLARGGQHSTWLEPPGHTLTTNLLLCEGECQHKGPLGGVCSVEGVSLHDGTHHDPDSSSLQQMASVGVPLMMSVTVKVARSVMRRARMLAAVVKFMVVVIGLLLVVVGNQDGQRPVGGSLMIGGWLRGRGHALARPLAIHSRNRQVWRRSRWLAPLAALEFAARSRRPATLIECITSRGSDDYKLKALPSLEEDDGYREVKATVTRRTSRAAILLST